MAPQNEWPRGAGVSYVLSGGMWRPLICLATHFLEPQEMYSLRTADFLEKWRARKKRFFGYDLAVLCVGKIFLRGFFGKRVFLTKNGEK